MRSIAMFFAAALFAAMFLVASLLATVPGFAQTPEVPARTHHKPALSAARPASHPAGHAATHSAVRLTAKPAARSPARPPVISPRHGMAARRPVHKAAPLVVAPVKAAPKLAQKPAAPAKPPIPADQGTVTGLHLPRYASLKTDDVNMRSGPGSRYPVLWTYKRRELPVRIEREFDVWRLVEDMDGTKGWVHQATLTGRRTFVITGADARTVRSDASDGAAAVAVLKPGVVGRVRGCEANAAWCKVQVGEYGGWLARADFWGSDAGELVTP